MVTCLLFIITLSFWVIKNDPPFGHWVTISAPSHIWAVSVDLSKLQLKIWFDKELVELVIKVFDVVLVVVVVVVEEVVDVVEDVFIIADNTFVGVVDNDEVVVIGTVVVEVINFESVKVLEIVVEAIDDVNIV